MKHISFKLLGAFAIMASALPVSGFAQQLNCPKGSQLNSLEKMSEADKGAVSAQLSRYSLFNVYDDVTALLADYKVLSFCTRKDLENGPLMLEGPFLMVPTEKAEWKRNSYSGAFVDGVPSGDILIKEGNSSKVLAKVGFEKESGNMVRSTAYSTVDGKPYIDKFYSRDVRLDVVYRDVSTPELGKRYLNKRTAENSATLVKLANGKTFCDPEGRMVSNQYKVMRERKVVEAGVDAGKTLSEDRAYEWLRTMQRVGYDTVLTTQDMVGTAKEVADRLTKQLMQGMEENFEKDLPEVFTTFEIKFDPKTGLVSVPVLCKGKPLVNLTFDHKYASVEEVNCTFISDFVKKAYETEVEPLCALHELEAQLKEAKSDSDMSLADKAKISELNQKIELKKTSVKSAKERMKSVGIIAN